MVKTINIFLQSFCENQNLNATQFERAAELIVIRDLKTFDEALITLQPMKLILIIALSFLLIHVIEKY